ncbi:MAG: hypothetical protein LBV23_01415 [Deltaproteobacteria bacterium]|jgi:hypothetical protein|nr:hypothetical protein [Deltaproteobacteria bacterium]
MIYVVIILNIILLFNFFPLRFSSLSFFISIINLIFASTELFKEFYSSIDNDKIEVILKNLPIFIFILNIILSLLYMYLVFKLLFIGGMGAGVGILSFLFNPAFYAPFFTSYFSFKCFK